MFAAKQFAIPAETPTTAELAMVHPDAGSQAILEESDRARFAGVDQHRHEPPGLSEGRAGTRPRGRGRVSVDSSADVDAAGEAVVREEGIGFRPVGGAEGFEVVADPRAGADVGDAVAVGVDDRDADAA